MKKLLIKILALLYKLRIKWNGNLYHYKRAVRQAAEIGSTGRRRYVYFLGGKYHVFCRKDIQRLKNAGVFKNHINTHSLAKVCLFDTRDSINRHPNPKYRKFKI